MKKDYAYILLLKPEISSFLEKIQRDITEKYSKAVSQWPPHVTLARGSFLTDQELVVVKEKLAQIHLEIPHLVSQGFVFEKKGENNYALRVGIENREDLHKLGKDIFEATKDFEAPIQTFTNEKYWITVAGGVTETEKIEIEDYLKELVILKVVPLCFSIFYSTFNSDKPKEAYEVARFL